MFSRQKAKLYALEAATLLSLGVAGCAEAPPAKAVPEAKAVLRGVALYLPLEDNSVLAYETTNTEEQKGFLAVQITRKGGGLVELKAGEKSQMLEVAGDSVRHVSGGLLLKWPLATGDTFPGEFATVRVVTTDRAIQVPAGSFKACVETLEAATEGPLQQQSRKVFCPNVGLVFFENQVSRGSEVNSQTAALRSFGPKIDVFAEPDPAH
ncbi:MAG: hypothetical protein SFV15_26525 [Polyangiaceae bacterium]|nr:hypothetical protein [Polyangiaceae bacterium]